LSERDNDIQIRFVASAKTIFPAMMRCVGFLKKLAGHADLLEKCFTDLVKESRQLLPGFGSSSL